jgi:LPXTG-site transpeptidase (sortase) family protein
MAGRLVRGALLWMSRVLLVLGVACVAGVYLTWRHAAFVQLQAKAEMAKLAAAGRLPGDSGWRRAADAAEREDSLIGVLDIPRLNVSVAVLEGDDDGTLAVAAGHLSDTPLPWDDGNAALAGHRDTFFRPLQDVRVGDQMHLATRYGELAYRVNRIIIVGANDVWVLDPAEDADLTLITCYPFDYFGLAPKRFVVQAERIPADPDGATRP